MKYQPPYGITDPNAGYINGNPAAGIEGSIPPAAAFEFPMREIVSAIQYSNFTPSDGDLQQLLKAIRSQFLNFVVDQGASQRDGGCAQPRARCLFGWHAPACSRGTQQQWPHQLRLKSTHLGHGLSNGLTARTFSPTILSPV